MNFAYDLTATITHADGLSFIAGYLLMGNWLEWAVLIVAYPVSIWMLTAGSSGELGVANRMAMLLSCIYVLVALFALLRSRKKIIAANAPMKIAGNAFYTVTEPEKKNDKIGRFLSEEKLTQFNSVINEFLQRKKPFLQQKYSLGELAHDVHIPLNYLSAFINRYHKMHYTDFINRYRVSESKEMILGGEWKYKTLEAIAFESGFNNRNTFTAAFRKETGQSPSEFLKEVKKRHKESMPSP